MKTKLWLCGQFRPITGRWEFQGIFSSREKAIAACRNENYFIQPVNLDDERSERTCKVKKKPLDTHCPECGTPWQDHDGMTLTCRKLVKARAALELIRGWTHGMYFTTCKAQVEELCAKTLKGTK